MTSCKSSPCHRCRSWVVLCQGMTEDQQKVSRLAEFCHLYPTYAAVLEARLVLPRSAFRYTSSLTAAGDNVYARAECDQGRSGDLRFTTDAIRGHILILQPRDPTDLPYFQRRASGIPGPLGVKPWLCRIAAAATRASLAFHPHTYIPLRPPTFERTHTDRPFQTNTDGL
jgi:hypothetical protein